MCGMAGFFGTEPVAFNVTERITDQLRNRGPDSQHSQTWDQNFRSSRTEVYSALINTRLAIIDPRSIADQPMSNEAGDIWISYNGEVFGWQQDAERLQASGVVFKTRSDTEFILRAYSAWGIDFLSRLRGMFAIAIVDLRLKQVFLIRDRMGIKPLIYSVDGTSLAFGSTVRSVLPARPPNDRQLRPESIDAYLAHRYIPAPHTIFEKISRLENGHYLKFDLTNRTAIKHRYWIPAPSGRSWEAELDHSVAMQTVSDRPVGLFLSSGIDSSLIAKRLVVTESRSFKSFTATFPGSPMDEGPDAESFARELGLRHRSIPIPYEVAGDFDRVIADLDEPFADPSSFPTWYLAREASKEVKVAIGGDGGDELLAGYKRYSQHLRSSWRGNFRIPGIPTVPSADRKGLSKMLSEVGMTWQESYSLRFSGFTPGQRAFLQPNLHIRQKTHWRDSFEPETSPIGSLIGIDMQNYLPEYILRKSDLCSMAHGLELRVPLLDHGLYEALLSVPETERYTTPAKGLFRSMFSSKECETLWSRKKRGFNPPLNEWLRNDLGERTSGLGVKLSELTNRQLAASGVDQIVRNYNNGARHLAEQVLQLAILAESLDQLANGSF